MLILNFGIKIKVSAKVNKARRPIKNTQEKVMRHLNYITVALLGACVAFSAHAADNPCDLVDWHDFQSLGAGENTPFSEAGWHKEPTPKEIPGSELFTNMCAGAIITKAGFSSVTLSLDSFKGKVTEQQVGDWLKTTAAKLAEQPDETITNIKIVQEKDATCESGQYELSTKMDDGSVADVVEHYMACDELVGIHHVSLNIHVPENKVTELPNPEQVKALLDKSVARLKQKPSFNAPDKSV